MPISGFKKEKAVNADARAAAFPPPANARHTLPGTLSQREKQVAALLMTDAPRKVLADKLSITAATFNKHVERVYKKTDCVTRLEFIAKYSGGPKGFVNETAAAEDEAGGL